MRLVKGAKETFGWVVVGVDRELVIPPAAWERYGFRVAEGAVFLAGSKTSGGFGLTCQRLMAGLSLPIAPERVLGTGRFGGNREVRIPEGVPVRPGDRLLSAFGSRYLGFISRGRIYEQALRHPELEVFKKEYE